MLFNFLPHGEKTDSQSFSPAGGERHGNISNIGFTTYAHMSRGGFRCNGCGQTQVDLMIATTPRNGQLRPFLQERNNPIRATFPRARIHLGHAPSYSRIGVKLESRVRAICHRQITHRSTTTRCRDDHSDRFLNEIINNGLGGLPSSINASDAATFSEIGQLGREIRHFTAEEGTLSFAGSNMTHKPPKNCHSMTSTPYRQCSR